MKHALLLSALCLLACGEQGGGQASTQPSAGVNGSNGADGTPVAPGEPGADGAQGVQGPQGPTGVQGPTGPEGPEGPAGADGQSVAGPQGPAGIQGPRGDQGAQGPQGPVGPQGEPGEDGEAGPEGPAGPPGFGPAGVEVGCVVAGSLEGDNYSQEFYAAVLDAPEDIAWADALACDWISTDGGCPAGFSCSGITPYTEADCLKVISKVINGQIVVQCGTATFDGNGFQTQMSRWTRAFINYRVATE